jgi:hypothetical protein
MDAKGRMKEWITISVYGDRWHYRKLKSLVPYFLSYQLNHPSALFLDVSYRGFRSSIVVLCSMHWPGMMVGKFEACATAPNLTNLPFSLYAYMISLVHSRNATYTCLRRGDQRHAVAISKEPRWSCWRSKDIHIGGAQIATVEARVD